VSTVKLAKGQGRKPSDLAAQARYGNQDEIWRQIRALKAKPSWTLSDLVCQLAKNGVHVNDATVKSYVTRLRRGGFLTCKKGQTIKGKGCIKADSLYQLAKDCGYEAPRLRKSGERTKQGSGTEQMWRTMKILSTFTPTQLSVTASTEDTVIKLSTAKAYCAKLRKAGYLAVAKPGGPNVQATYRFLKSKNTGPIAPQVQRTHRVFDPNLKKIMWESE
jgi:hypothetical protein